MTLGFSRFFSCHLQWICAINNISRQIYLTDNPEVIHSCPTCVSALFSMRKVSVHLLQLSVSSSGFLGSRHQVESDGSPSSDSNYKFCKKTRKPLPQVTIKDRKKLAFVEPNCVLGISPVLGISSLQQRGVQPCSTEAVTLTRKG